MCDLLQLMVAIICGCFAQAIQVEGLAQAQEVNGSTAGISLSAQAAQQGWQAVQTFVALTQIQQVVRTARISEEAPVPQVTDAILRKAELREGATVAMDQQVTCTVAFARGQERRVCFAVQGTPQVSVMIELPQCCTTCKLYQVD